MRPIYQASRSPGNPHSASYFIIGNLRKPISDDLDIDELACNSDVSIYERGWKRHEAHGL